MRDRQFVKKSLDGSAIAFRRDRHGPRGQGRGRRHGEPRRPRL